MLSGSGVWCKAVLLVAVSLVMFPVVVKLTEEQEQSVDKRAKQTPTTLADVIKVLMDMQRRMKALESSRSILLRGRDGRDGKPGKNGGNGIPGKPGKNGGNGIPGKPGKDGRDGVPGKPGRDGRNNGLPGKPGAPGVQGLRGPPGTKSGGVQYVRWGRTTCPSGRSRVYKGRIGGEYYNHKGGGANYVCLPETPKYGRYKPGHQNAGYMYGTEYEDTGTVFTRTNLLSHEAPCAVCYVQTRSTKMMIPATYQCPAGWTREYQGYLMSAYHNHPHPTQYICVDNGAEPVPGTHADLNGALLYPVEGRCGSLPCLPYVDGRELTCAVCTK